MRVDGPVRDGLPRVRRSAGGGSLGGATGGPDAAGDGAALDAYSRAVTSVAERLLPSVASLELRGTVRGRPGPVGAGSAVVLSPDGLLVTSAHVVERAREGVARFTDGLETGFTVVGADRLSDLAVLRVDGGADLHPVELGDAETLREGQLVVAVGNPLGMSGSVSAGVVSGLGRSLTTRSGRAARLIENVIQTDAALHPGNSGGALADSRGRVVGINTAVLGPGIGQGLGMAVPVNSTTRHIIAALVRHGRVRRSYLGVTGGSRPLPPRAARATGQDRGVEVLSVEPDSPAAAAGLRPEDIILRLGEAPVRGVGDLQEILTRQPVGGEVEVAFVRGGEVTTARLVTTELQA